MFVQMYYINNQKRRDILIMKKVVFLIAIAVGILNLSACSTTDKKDSSAIVPVNASSSVAYDPINDPKTSIYKLRSVYFDFDSYTIQQKDIPLIQAHANYLIANKSKKLSIVVQGNTDERGTTEYNLALGQKRSEAVKRSLVLLGVDANQVEAVSFGKEKPKNMNHNEEAWKDNRRVDIVYR